MSKTLLIVDDERNIVSALKRLFRREDVEVLTADSGASGLEILNSTKIGVILSDHMMPEMTGVEFLRQAQEIQPDTVRIVLSGYTDLKTIVDSINKGAIWRFLTKPWDDELLKNTVYEAFENYQLKETNKQLTKELSEKNETLRVYTNVLEGVIEEKTQSLAFNQKALQISHDILEQLDVAIMGVDEAGTIVIANRYAHKYLSVGGKLMLGKNITSVFPIEFCEAVLQTDSSTHHTLADSSLSGEKLNASVIALQPPALAKGFILTFSKSME